MGCSCIVVSNLPDPPEYANIHPAPLTQLMVGAPFTLNCTPSSAANPPVHTVSIKVDRSPVTSSDIVTVTDIILYHPIGAEEPQWELILNYN